MSKTTTSDTQPPQLDRSSRLRRRGRALVPLELELALASFRRGELVVPVLTALAIGVAVALVGALEIAFRAMDVSLARSSTALVGRADLELYGGGEGVREDLLPEILATPGVADAQGVMTYAFQLAEPGLLGAPLHVIGVDLTLEDPILGRRVEGATVEVGDRLRLLGVAGSVVISRSLAERLGVGLGDPIRVADADGHRTLGVEGLVSGPVSDAYAGQVGVMDLYALQDLVGSPGRVERIVVVVEPGASPEVVAAALEERFGDRAQVGRAGDSEELLGGLVDGLRALLRSIVAVGTAVAILITYAAMRRRAERRRLEFASLRLAGIESRRVARVFWIDSLLIGLAGTAIGIPLGRAAAPFLLGGLAGLPELGPRIDPGGVGLTGTTLALCFGVGLLLSGAGALLPAWRLGRRPALDHVRPTAVVRDRRDRSRLQPALWLGGALGVVGFAIVPLSTPAFEVPRGALVLVLGTTLVGFAVRALLPLVVRGFRPLAERFAPRVGSLAGATLSARPGESALGATMVVAVLAAAVALGVLISSISASTLYEIRAMNRGSVYVRAGAPARGVPTATLGPETVARIRDVPGVVEASGLYENLHPFRDRTVGLVRLELSGPRAQNGLIPTRGSSLELAQRLRAGDVAVTPGFARTFDVAVGDAIELRTPAGLRAFRVAGLARDTSSGTGRITFDMAVGDLYWPRPGVTLMRLWTDGNPETLAHEVARATAGRELVHIMLGDALIEIVKQLLVRLQAAIWSVAAAIGVFGGLGILITLLGTVADRRRENEILMAVGLSRMQVTATVAIDGVLATGIAAVGGTALGLALVPVFAEVPRAHGYSFDVYLRPLDVLPLAAFALVAAGLSCIYPALQASRGATRELAGD